MITSKTLVAAFALLGVATATQAAGTAVDLAREKQCMSCHAVDKDALAPGFAGIAKKYKGRAGAEAMLVTTVKNGSPEMGGYHWGTMKMPSSGVRPTVSDDEAKVLVQWVLSQ